MMSVCSKSKKLIMFQGTEEGVLLINQNNLITSTLTTNDDMQMYFFHMGGLQHAFSLINKKMICYR